jgi:hypothetical protein
MSKIYADFSEFVDQPEQHFLMDSKGDLYQVSEELAEAHAKLYPQSTAVVSEVDTKTNTIYFTSPLPAKVKAEKR